MNPNEWYERQQKFGKAMKKIEEWKLKHCEIKNCNEIAVVQILILVPLSMYDKKDLRLCHEHLKRGVKNFYNL